jgi:hypothetical protein
VALLLGGVAAAIAWTNTDTWLAALAVASLLIGAVVGRWWVLLVPAAVLAYTAIGCVVAPDANADAPAVAYAVFTMLFGVGLVVLPMSLGIGLRRFLGQR